MIDSKTNFDVIENLLKEYKRASNNLNLLKTQLEEIKGELKELRKDLTVKSLNEKILAKNTLRDRLKIEISETKRVAKKAFIECEALIFEGIKRKYSEVYDKQLSRLYGKKVEIIVKSVGDDYDEYLCDVKNVIITKNKDQHKKILAMLDFGILETADNYPIKKALVEICVYNKKIHAGTVLPFDTEMLWKNINI